MLCYVDDALLPGITRKRRGRYWQYFNADGERIIDRDEIDRLNKIGLPPAYERCWFCPRLVGHIQAIGYDAKGRKQYRYHEGFRARAGLRNTSGWPPSAGALPKLRKKVDEDISGRSMRRNTVLAAVVRLIDSTHMRVGNEALCQGE
jgi:DNA topoisomerase-1